MPILTLFTKHSNGAIIECAFIKRNNQSIFKNQNKNKTVLFNEYLLYVVKHAAIKPSACISGRGFHTKVSVGAS